MQSIQENLEFANRFRKELTEHEVSKENNEDMLMSSRRFTQEYGSDFWNTSDWNPQFQEDEFRYKSKSKTLGASINKRMYE